MYRQPGGLLELGEEQMRASCKLLNNRRVGEPSREGAVFFRWKRKACYPILGGAAMMLITIKVISAVGEQPVLKRH
jgi:hypothetical protein